MSAATSGPPAGLEDVSDGNRESALRHFSVRLEAVRLAVGKPSYAKLHAAVTYLRTSTISTVLRGETNPTLDFVLNFVRACGIIARRAGYPIDNSLVSEQTWRNAWLDLQRQLGALRRHGRQPAERAAKPVSRHCPAGLQPPRQLPPDVSVFTGRLDELAALDLLLTRSDTLATPIIVIDGMPGVGKTTLAVHWAHRVRYHFTDGDLFVDLRGFGPDQMIATEVALTSLLRALGAPTGRTPIDLAELTARYRTLTANRRLLVVLDNAVSADQVRPLVPVASGAMVVVTSRNSLSRLASHEGVERITVRPMSQHESEQLLVRIVGERAKRAPEDTANVANLCGYLPIMLRLVGERANTRPYATMAILSRELVSRRRLEMTVEATPDGYSLTPSLALSWSYEALPETSRSTFRRLGLHPTSELSLAAASALLGQAPDETRRRLDNLTSTHLLEEIAADRYRLHDLLADYARNLCDEHDTEVDRLSAMTRLLDWYLQTADAADRQLVPARRHVTLKLRREARQPLTVFDYDGALNWCDVECANLVAATRLAASIGQLSTAWRLPYAVLGYFHLRKPWHMWIEACTIATDSARKSQDRLGLASSLYALGIAYRETGSHNLATNCFDESLALYRQLDDLWGQAHVLTNLGATASNRGSAVLALDNYRRALEISRELDDKRALRISLSNVAEAEAKFGRYELALAHAQAAATLSVEIKDEDGHGRSLCTAGYACVGLGAPEAQDYYRRAIAIMDRVGDRHGAAIALDRLGQLLRNANQLAEARDAASRALDIFEALDDPHVVEVRQRLSEVDEDIAAC